MGTSAGLDIGGTKISAVLLDGGRIVGRDTVRAPAGEGGAAMADAAAAAVRALAAGHGERLDAVGVGAAGVIDADHGIVRAASSIFVGWAGFPLADELADRLGVGVRVENDVNAFLVGELYGEVEARDVLGLMLGTGVGGAVVLDGELRRGPHGAAGEIGHTPGYGERRCTCGQAGHLETVASGTSIARRYGEATGRLGLDARGVAKLARAGDPAANEVYADAGRAIALAGVVAAGLLDLTHVVVGGGVARAWDLLGPAVDETLRTDAPISGVPLRFAPSRLGPDAVPLGAAIAAQRVLTSTAEGSVR